MDQRKALIVVDVQHGLTLKRKLFDESNFIETIHSAIEKLREENDIVIFIQHNNNLLKPGTQDWKIDSRIEPKPNDIIIQKQHGNAFIKTDLGSILINESVREIIVCGLVSHGCVRATCLGGIAEGFKIYLLKNGHTNWHKEAKMKIQTVETELIENGVRVVDLKEF